MYSKQKRKITILMCIILIFINFSSINIPATAASDPDVIFILPIALDTAGSTGLVPSQLVLTIFNAERDLIYQASQRILKQYTDARIWIITYAMDEAAYLRGGNQYYDFDSLNDMNNDLNALQPIPFDLETDPQTGVHSVMANRGKAFDLIIEDKNLFRDKVFTYYLHNSASNVSADSYDQLDLCNLTSHIYSEIAPSAVRYIEGTYANSVLAAIEKSRGFSVRMDEHSPLASAVYVYEHIVDICGDPFEAFDVKKDGYGFQNHEYFFGQGATEPIPLDVYTEVLGPVLGSQCYWLMLPDEWAGRCFGMALTSGLYYDNKLDLFPYGVEYLYDIPAPRNNPPRSDELVKTIEKFQVSQFLLFRSNYDYNLDHLIKAVENFQKTGKEPVFIGGSSSTGGHEVLGYAVRQDNYGNYIVSLYDNNFPGVTKNLIISANKNSWYFDIQEYVDLDWRFNSIHPGSELEFITPSMIGDIMKPLIDNEGPYYKIPNVAFITASTRNVSIYNTAGTDMTEMSEYEIRIKDSSLNPKANYRLPADTYRIVPDSNSTGTEPFRVGMSDEDTFIGVSNNETFTAEVTLGEQPDFVIENAEGNLLVNITTIKDDLSKVNVSKDDDGFITIRLLDEASPPQAGFYADLDTVTETEGGRSFQFEFDGQLESVSGDELDFVEVASPLEDFEYVIENDKVTITKYKGSDSKVVIPSEISGYPVTSIGRYAFLQISAENLVIPNTVTALDNYSIYQCLNLTNIKIGNSVTNIGTHNFFQCLKLETVTLPDTVKTIGDYSFYQCQKLKSVEVPGSDTSIGLYAFYSNAADFAIYGPDNSPIARYANTNGIRFYII